jgi:transposase
MKKRAAPPRLDRLPRRERILSPPTGKGDLGTEGPHAGAATPVRLDPAVDVRRAGLPARPQPGRAVVPDQQGAYNTESLIEFPTDLHAHFDAEKVTLIWDGLSSHKSRQMKAWIATQRHWLVVERLPGYAPDLNPIEMVWGNVKQVELANSARRPSTRPTSPRKPAWSRWAPATSCASPSSLTPLFLYELRPQSIPERSLGHPGCVVCRVHSGDAERTLEAAYRLGSDRGSPNHGSTLLSKRVKAQIRSPVRVRTNRPVPWRMPEGARR